MPDLNFEVERAEPLPHAATPQLVFKLRIVEAGDGATETSAVALRCQIRIEPSRRRYDPTEEERLLDLFGAPARWGQTLRSMLWIQTGLIVPAFAGRTVVDLPVPCTFDFNVAATKYFYALEDGEVPLTLLFSGSVFYVDPDGGGLQVGPIPWEKETMFRLPVRIWKEMMDHYYPNSAWLCLRQDVFDQLYLYKSRQGLPTWDQALQRLLDASSERVEP
jgi:Family of unknown function (DUF6084)